MEYESPNSPVGSHQRRRSFGERQARVLISWVVPQQFKGSNGFALLLRYVVLSPVGHMSTHQSLEEFPVVRNP